MTNSGKLKEKNVYAEPQMSCTSLAFMYLFLVYIYYDDVFNKFNVHTYGHTSVYH